MEDRFEYLPETFDEMMLLPNVPDLRPSHRNLTKVHQIRTAGGAVLEKEEHNCTKGWTASLDSTRRHINPPCGILQNLYFPLNFRTQTASEFGFKPPTKRFVKLARLSQVPSKFEKWRANPRFYVLRADIHCR